MPPRGQFRVTVSKDAVTFFANARLPQRVRQAPNLLGNHAPEYKRDRQSFDYLRRPSQSLELTEALPVLECVIAQVLVEGSTVAPTLVLSARSQASHKQRQNLNSGRFQPVWFAVLCRRKRHEKSREISGHKTDYMFSRYKIVSEADNRRRAGPKIQWYLLACGFFSRDFADFYFRQM